MANQLYVPDFDSFCQWSHHSAVCYHWSQPIYSCFQVILLALILLNDHLGKLARHELTVVELTPLLIGLWVMRRPNS